MRGDKKQAFSLRNLGKSYSAIVLELGVPKSTLSDWFKNDKWSILGFRVNSDAFLIP